MALQPRMTQRLGWRPDHPDYRDRILRPPGKLPQAINLRNTGFFDFAVFDQSQLGSCVSNATSAAIRYAERREGTTDLTPTTIPSRLAIYWWARYLEGSVDADAGCEIRDALKVVARTGYYDESRWPYDISRFRDRPPELGPNPEHVYVYARVQQTRQSFLGCLAIGYPVIIGVSVYESWPFSGTPDVPMPKPGEGVLGGHAVLATGYDLSRVGSEVEFLNSWGSGWGRDGYGRLPLAYVLNLGLGGDYWQIQRET